MAGLKKLNTRIIHKHATASVWNDSNFTPLQGELVIYDPSYDSTDGKTYTRERMKIGDGTHTIQELPFANEIDAKLTEHANEVTVVTQVPQPVYTSSSYTPPSMSQEYNNEHLKLTFDAGAYVPATFAAEPAKTTTIEYLTDVELSVGQPV